MRKNTAAVAVPLLSASLLLTACGGNSSNTAGTVGSAATASKVATSTATATAGSAVATTDAASSCPTSSTQSFAKTRFVTNVSLAGGTFYQWIYKPYQAGKFQQGASGRTATLVKAGLAGAFAAKQVKDATANVKADPTLCKVFIGPMTALSSQLDTLKDKVKSGDVSQIAGVAATVTSLTALGQANGLNFDMSKSGL